MTSADLASPIEQLNRDCFCLSLDPAALAHALDVELGGAGLSELVREGIVISHRGREGGYELALAPVDIRYGDIIRLTRGSLALVPCASRNAHEHCTNCLPEVECRLRGLMLTLRDEMAAMLDKVSLADPITVEAPFGESEG